MYELARNSNANFAAEFRRGRNSHARRGGINNNGAQNSRDPLQPLPHLCVNSSFKGGAHQMTGHATVASKPSPEREWVFFGISLVLGLPMSLRGTIPNRSKPNSSI